MAKTVKSSKKKKQTIVRDFNWMTSPKRDAEKKGIPVQGRKKF